MASEVAEVERRQAPTSSPSSPLISASYKREGAKDVNGLCDSVEDGSNSVNELRGTARHSPKYHGSRNDATATSHTNSISKEDTRTASSAFDKFQSLIRDVRSLNVGYMTLSSSLSGVEKRLASEIAANEKRKAIVENTAFTVKKELTTLVRDEVSALKSIHAEDIVQIRLDHQKELETMRKTISSQTARIEQLEEEVGRLHLRVGLLDSCSPAFVTVTSISTISDKTFSDSPTFYSEPCGHPMHLSVVKSPQGGLVVMLNIDNSSSTSHNTLVAWPVVGRVVVEAIGFPVMESRDLNLLLVGTVDLDEKSGRKGGGGYVGALSDQYMCDSAQVLLQMSHQSGMFKAKEKPVLPFYYVHNDTLSFRVIVTLRQSRTD